MLIYSIFNTEHAVVDHDNIYKYYVYPNIFTKVRADRWTDRPTKKQTNRTLQLCWEVFKMTYFCVTLLNYSKISTK